MQCGHIMWGIIFIRPPDIYLCPMKARRLLTPLQPRAIIMFPINNRHSRRKNYSSKKAIIPTTKLLVLKLRKLRSSDMEDMAHCACHLKKVIKDWFG